MGGVCYVTLCRFGVYRKRYLRKLFLPIVYNDLFATIFCVTRKMVHIATSMYRLFHKFLALTSYWLNFHHLKWLKFHDLSFSTHVRQVCAKASRTLGLLRRNLRNFPQKLRELAYTSMCWFVLEYASPTWDPYLQRDIDSLERIQRKAARFTTRDFHHRSSVTAMMHNLQWEPLAERRTKARVILMYLILNDEVAIPISPSLLQPGWRGQFIQPAHHYQLYKHSFYPWTVHDWNLLSSKLKDSPSLDSFKNGLPVRYY